MPKTIPSKASAMDALGTQVMEGAYLGVGETLGRSLLGPGIGTMAGGLAAASSESGASRDRMAMVSGERAVSELLAGSGGGNSSGGNRGSI
jgi:hypothetical protein